MTNLPLQESCWTYSTKSWHAMCSVVPTSFRMKHSTPFVAMAFLSGFTWNVSNFFAVTYQVSCHSSSTFPLYTAWMKIHIRIQIIRILLPDTQAWIKPFLCILSSYKSILIHHKKVTGIKKQNKSCFKKLIFFIFFIFNLISINITKLTKNKWFLFYLFFAT